MRMTRSLVAALVILVIPSVRALADDKPAAAAPAPKEEDALAALKKEYQDASRAWSKEAVAALEEARKQGKEKSFKYDKPSPGAEFSPRFLEIAEKNPASDQGLDAIVWTLQTSSGSQPGVALETRAKAIALLDNHYVDKPQIKRVLRLLTSYDDDCAKKLVDTVIARNPDRKIQALAYKGQIAHRESLTRFLDVVKDSERREALEASNGKAAIEERIAKGEKALKELDELQNTLREKYGDVFADLSIGKEAPEILTHDIEGNDAKLSALRGRVVVLDIWATWCGPCRAMIPHEREMVERLKDKPFTLVSISGDEKKETLTDFLAKEKMPWTHWWNGNKGGILEDWDVQYFPTIYVLDTKGVIRHKDLRGEALEKAVNALLEETEPKKTASN